MKNLFFYLLITLLGIQFGNYSIGKPLQYMGFLFSIMDLILHLQH
nr:MAG TPA: hypothetical protein [Caudoviricetes sp.]